MPKMLQEIKQAISEVTSKALKVWTALAYPDMRLTNASETKEEMKSTEYRSVMEKLMYYITKVAPKTVNAV